MTTPPALNDQDILVAFVDVGQGDCTILIDGATRNALIIDCPAMQEAKAKAILDFYQAHFHTAIVTHFDADHSVGLLALIEDRDPSLVVLRAVENETPGVIAQYRRLYSKWRRKRIGLQGFRLGLQDSMGRIDWTLVGPLPETELSAATRLTAESEKHRQRNRTSLVTKVSLRPTRGGTPRRLLVAGDADGTSWKHLLEAGTDLTADFFVWPHHGALIGRESSTALAARVLKAVDPRTIRMSVGSLNTHKHPRRESLRHAALVENATIYCAQVTKLCAGSSFSGSASCAGDVYAVVTPEGTVTMHPDESLHRAAVQHWKQPQCLMLAKRQGAVHPTMQR